MNIDLANDFSPYPAGRFPGDGKFNGERFRNEFLVPKIKAIIDSGADEKLVIDIDGVRSFGSSFLEEAFAALVRLDLFKKADVRRIIAIRCTKPHLFFFRDTILSYIEDARVDLVS